MIATPVQAYDQRDMSAVRLRGVGRLLAVALPTLAGATVIVSYLQDVLGVPNPSAVYLVAVVATAIVSGTLGAVATAVASFVLYNYLFTEPRFTLSMHEPGVWISVVLLLFVGIVVGQLAALQRSRADVAHAREREARALFAVSRGLSTRESIEAVLPQVARELQAEAHMARVWITLGQTEAPTGTLNQLRRMPGATPAQWVRVHQAAGRPSGPTNAETYRVLIEARGGFLGSVWAQRARDDGPPTPDETRLLSAAADQLGQAIAHDRLASDAHAAEVARESDALKSALLQSVSHDLRTPLATIRAAAGTLRASAASGAERESVEAIEREVEYLNRLVTNLLDLSRIEAGVLHAQSEPFELEDAVGAALERLAPRLVGWRVESEVGREVVRADPVFLDAVLTNALDNIVRHTPSGTTIRLLTAAGRGQMVRLTIEDSGPGVPDEALARLFDKFYRVPGSRGSRHGTGIGLAVVQGLVEAMGGQVAARRSELGGLAIDIDLPLAAVPAELAVPA
ncbi:MAG TPA: ATP-binding protein [Candidatus Limnocylindria bacterium]|nr:ATP-binding protein [Candidatus Limnocylindria bacterium]